MDAMKIQVGVVVWAVLVCLCGSSNNTTESSESSTEAGVTTVLLREVNVSGSTEGSLASDVVGSTGEFVSSEYNRCFLHLRNVNSTNDCESAWAKMRNCYRERLDTSNSFVNTGLDLFFKGIDLQKPNCSTEYMCKQMSRFCFLMQSNKTLDCRDPKKKEEMQKCSGLVTEGCQDAAGTQYLTDLGCATKECISSMAGLSETASDIKFGNLDSSLACRLLTQTFGTLKDKCTGSTDVVKKVQSDKWFDFGRVCKQTDGGMASSQPWHWTIVTGLSVASTLLLVP